MRPASQYSTKGFLMETPVIWKRPDLQFPTPFDTIFFDVDGVLIKTIDSFHATDIATAEYVAGVFQKAGLEPAGNPASKSYIQAVRFKTRKINEAQITFLDRLAAAVELRSKR